MIRPAVPFHLALAFASTLLATPVAAEVEAAIDAITGALSVICDNWKKEPKELGRLLGNAEFVDQKIDKFQGYPVRFIRNYDLPSGARFRITAVIPGNKLRRVGVVYLQPSSEKTDGDAGDAGDAGGDRDDWREVMMALAGPGCEPQDVRRLVYGADGTPQQVVFMDATFKDTARREPLDAPVPAGTDPGGVTVALVDSGINYTLPNLADRLARDREGRFLGFDYWDMDARPFDVNAAVSHFFPFRHGSRVANLLVAEAPDIRLIPYRYPRPDMTRMGDLIADADGKGALIVAMPMGSNKSSDWQAFEKAARQRPHMLFILSAGNNGRDIDLAPVYPAALKLDNALVVTSSTADGTLGRGNNWSRNTVHIMVPAEKLDTLDHLGQPTRVSGSSFAVPRVAALAARLLAANPDWKAAELKQAILARARPVPNPKAHPSKYGWIPNPENDG